MKAYHDLLNHILSEGYSKDDRTGTGTISVFGYQMRLNLQKGFPLLTTKKLHLKSIIHELLWFLKGDTNIKYLTDNGVRIWNEWADEKGDLGPIYGHQWRNWNSQGIDQITQAITQIKTNPNNRRIIVTAWNPSVMPNTSLSFAQNVANGKAALPPCHAFFQFYVGEKKTLSEEVKPHLSLQLYQRSADAFLGVPFNIASYALLLHMVAQECGLPVGDFIHTFGDLHIYNNHLKQVKEQLEREPRPLPKLVLNPEVKSVFDFKYSDISFDNYTPYPAIKAQVSV